MYFRKINLRFAYRDVLYKEFFKEIRCGDVSLPLSMEALDYAVGCENNLRCESSKV